ncbi:MAG TPA: bifunctional glutamate N-acetyltransferase/amino-acid acetyltransferase ArgJ [Terriglobales bacterium]|nr:bifunctional glutamate N-acetyltransferase/amino-acid acetyltransferase ArgJ [Terriglobales bacterium]
MSDLRVPRGFVFSAGCAGIKASGKPDLALAEAPRGANAAALFTRNRVVAAPLIVGREHLKKTRGRVRAVIVNSGNANCATGAGGMAATRAVCGQLGKVLQAAPEFIFPSSTGIIGVPLPVEKIRAALPQVVSGLASSGVALQQFEQAIMTTDTRPKIASATFRDGREAVTVTGVAKGAGMIHPNMATMLAYLFTDIDAVSAQLGAALVEACGSSFNCISVDGDTSTNDTLLLLASGASGIKLDSRTRKRFAEALSDVCQSLAEQIVADGEGVKHVIRLSVEGARTDAEAHAIANTIATSMLVKTAWAGADPNWGRILAAVGRSGIAVDPAKVDIFIGPHQVCRQGAKGEFSEDSAHSYMLRPQYDIRVRVGGGRGRVRLLTSDLTSEYVHINADYST